MSEPICRKCNQPVLDGGRPDPCPPDPAVQSVVHYECARGMIHEMAVARLRARNCLIHAAPLMLEALTMIRNVLRNSPWPGADLLAAQIDPVILAATKGTNP